MNGPRSAREGASHIRRSDARCLPVAAHRCETVPIRIDRMWEAPPRADRLGRCSVSSAFRRPASNRGQLKNWDAPHENGWFIFFWNSPRIGVQ